MFSQMQLPSTVRTIDVNANGKGFALLQLSYRYHLNNSDATAAFKLKPRRTEKSSDVHLNLEVCVR